MQAFGKGEASVASNGESSWPHVHIDGSVSALSPRSITLIRCTYHVVADLFIVVYKDALSGVAAHGEGYYFGENVEYKLICG